MARHSARNQDDSRRRRFGGWSTRTKVLSGVAGAALVGVTAYAVTNWVVGLNSGSSGQAQSATVSNLTISAVATPAAGNLLYPGGTGDVVATITNPNTFPVTITAVTLPSSTTYAAGYSDNGLTSTQSGCDATASLVAWNYAANTSAHTLTTPITVGASGNITVTFTNDAIMGQAAPAACENTYFKMPSLSGITATGYAATASTSPMTDSWTS